MNGVNEYFQSMDNIFLALNYAESLSRGDTARLAKSERAAQDPSSSIGATADHYGGED